MTTYINLLRGINVGGHRKIKMADLKTCYKSLGLTNIATYIQSGNVIFDSDADAVTLTNHIHTAIKEQFGFEVGILLHPITTWQSIYQNAPFDPEVHDPKKLVVTCFLEPFPEQAEAIFSTLTPKTEQLTLGEQVIYMYCPDGYGKTKITNAVLEKQFGMLATTRNWNTIQKLHNMAKS